MTYTDVCTGVSAATLAWKKLGWRAVAYSEVEPFPSSVLAHHYPETPNLGDMLKLKEQPHERVFSDVLVGGTPCQGFSIAGLRGGLEDPRGLLMLEYATLGARFRFPWLLWENVPGVLSSAGGRDFAAFLGLLTGRAVQAPVGGSWPNSGILAGIDSAYGIAWTVLDAQYFGVPQRRRRVFLVGYLGDWRRAAAVLFDAESLRGNPPPSREEGKGITHELAPSLTASGRGVERGGDSRGQDPVVAVYDMRGNGDGRTVSTLTGDHADRPTDYTPVVVAETLRGHPRPGSNSLGQTVVHALRGEGFDASEDGTGWGTPLVPMVFDETQITSRENRSQPQAGDPSHPLAASARPPTIAFDTKASGSRDFGAGEKSPTLRAMEGKRANGGGQVGVAAAFGVRRLTPRECERLQGFPDDYTLVPWKKPMADKGRARYDTMAPDSPRYKAIGNSMAEPCMEWLGRRIEYVQALFQEEP